MNKFGSIEIMEVDVIENTFPRQQKNKQKGNKKTDVYCHILLVSTQGGVIPRVNMAEFQMCQSCSDRINRRD